MMRGIFIAILASTLSSSDAFVTSNNGAFGLLKNSKNELVKCEALAFDTSGMWNAGNSYGKGEFKFYNSLEDWMKPFPEEDKQAYPEVFSLPEGVCEVSLRSPLGIIFEEIEAGRGVYVQDLVEGGNAERSGMIQPGDVLIAITAVKVIGAKWERRMIPALEFDFDTVVGAIGSNTQNWGCDGVVLQFQRPGESDPEKVKDFLDFFQPPSDSPWRQ